MTDSPIDSPASGMVQLVHERTEIDRAVRDILDALARLGYSESARFAVRLALEEAVSNAFRHGHSALPPDTPIDLRWRADPGQVRITIRDRGPGFDPASVPDPTLDENLEMPSGRGLMLMRAYMTSVVYNTTGNEVTMIFTPAPPPPPRKP